MAGQRGDTFLDVHSDGLWEESIISPLFMETEIWGGRKN